MPAGTFERSSPSAVAATPARSGESTPEKHRALSENRKSSRHSKLEKADILEMTVKHLRNLQRLQLTAAVTTDPSFLGKYRAGFSECVGEVTRFLSTCEGVHSEVRTRLLSHLASCVTQINTINFCTPHPGTSGLGQTGAQMPAASAMKLYAGFQVVPTPDGQFALIVPSAAVTPLGAQSGHHLSPAAPPVTLDSVWRPW
uniref:Hes family bHLH transcription factor 1 n=1 Tax=Takifugu rubripes TaxID=31033 RepID=A0A674NMZ3_TAKRU